MGSKQTLSVNTSAELLSYIINVTPELRDNIDLPKQGESIEPIGKIIINNQRYRNAFINTVNLIGLTVLKRNGWDNPWDFTIRGTLRWGQQVRELINDLCNVYDYNENFNDKDRFLDTVVPNVLNYMHEINFQKFYQTTTSDSQLAMAFLNDESLFDFVDDCISMLYESLTYDRYIINKYMLCRRMLDGTIPPTQISDYATKTARQRVSAIKSVSNKMTFRNPNYNPAGIRRATSFENQILIVNTEFEADFSTEVLATSFFKDEADMRARLVLCDGFTNHDTNRLQEVLGSAFENFTETELGYLANVPAVLISREWFMNYVYALDGESGERQTEFFNPTTLENNHFLHCWMVFSTSPFEQCTVFTSDTPAVSSVAVSPSTASVTKGQNLELKATVTAQNFANKGVFWAINSVAETAGAKINQEGKLSVPSNYNSTGSGTAGVYTINIATALNEGAKITVNSVTYTVGESDTTASNQGGALRSALNVSAITDYYAISGSGANAILTEKSGLYGQVGEPSFEVEKTSGSATITETTPGVVPNNTIIVSATSVYDNTKSGTAKITVS